MTSRCRSTFMTVALGSLAVLLPGRSHAQTADGPGLDLSVGLAQTSSVSQQYDSALGLGLLGRYRIGAWLLGANLELASTVFKHSDVFLGGLAGRVFESEWAELNLAVEAGRHTITGAGDEFFFINVSSESAQLPYAGVRFGVDYLRAGDLRRLGLGFFVRADLTQTKVTLSGDKCGFGCTSLKESRTVGGWVLGTFFHLGFGQ